MCYISAWSQRRTNLKGSRLNLQLRKLHRLKTWGARSERSHHPFLFSFYLAIRLMELITVPFHILTPRDFFGGQVTGSGTGGSGLSQALKICDAPDPWHCLELFSYFVGGKCDT